MVLETSSCLQTCATQHLIRESSREWQARQHELFSRVAGLQG